MIYSVCSKLGLDLPEYKSLDEISKFNPEQVNCFKDNLNVVRSISHQMLSNFESAIERSIRELDKKMKEQEQPEVEPIQEALSQATTQVKTSAKKKSQKEVEQC